MSEQDSTTEDLDVTAGTDRVDDTDEANLGDAGKKALDAMKTKWQKERDERKARDARIAELEADATAKVGKDGDETKSVDVEAIRAQAVKEARAEALQERVLDRIEARAAKRFEDPEDARLQLARHVKNFIDGDKVDTDAIDEALEQLLTKKPHLAAATAKRFQGSADGGARNGNKPSQLSRTDLKRLSPKQIVDARAEGRLDDLLSGK